MLIEINLLPEEHRKKDRLKLPELPVQKTVIIAFILFFGVQMALGGFAIYQKSRIGVVKNEISTLRDKTRDIARQKKEITALKTRLGEMDQFHKLRQHQQVVAQIEKRQLATVARCELVNRQTRFQILHLVFPPQRAGPLKAGPIAL